MFYEIRNILSCCLSAADRACNDSMGDAREGLVVSCVDAAETYKSHASITVPQGLVMPISLKLMPLYVLACLRTVYIVHYIVSRRLESCRKKIN